MTKHDYRQAIAEVFQIEAVLLCTSRRKDTRLIIRHRRLCSLIHAYERLHQWAKGAAA